MILNIGLTTEEAFFTCRAGAFDELHHTNAHIVPQGSGEHAKTGATLPFTVAGMNKEKAFIPVSSVDALIYHGLFSLHPDAVFLLDGHSDVYYLSGNRKPGRREYKVYAEVAEKIEITRRFCVPGICPETKKQDAESAEEAQRTRRKALILNHQFLHTLRILCDLCVPLFTSYSC